MLFIYLYIFIIYFRDSEEGFLKIVFMKIYYRMLENKIGIDD